MGPGLQHHWGCAVTALYPILRIPGPKSNPSTSLGKEPLHGCPAAGWGDPGQGDKDIQCRQEDDRDLTCSHPWLPRNCL